MTAYTNSLRLTLPVTGTDDGTWGDTVNTGITSLVDASIAGTATVAHDDTANYTLTDNDGATDEARQMFLNITGALTAARNVVCPGVSKLYFLTNNTTGGYAVTLKTSGGTGISVANGKSAALYCNGTNVVYAFDQVTLKPTVSIAGNMDSGTTDYAVTATPAIQSNVQTAANIFYTAPTTEADTFTLPYLRHFYAVQGTFGAGSTVTGQYGFVASSNLTGAQINVGFQSNIDSKTALTISTMNGSGTTVTVDTTTSHGLADNDYVFINLVPQTTMTSGSYNGYYQVTVVDANTFTYNSSATSSAAVTSGYVTPSGRWNFFANGTGQNRFDGSVIVNANSYVDALRITQTGAGNALVVEDATNPDTSPFVVTTTGLVRVGSTDALGSGMNFKMQISGISTDDPGIGIAKFATSGAPYITFGRSRNSTTTLGTAVIDGDLLGGVQFSGDDGDAWVSAAGIYSYVNGTPGNNDMPGRLAFSTRAAGASSPTERMAINSAGQVVVGTGYTAYTVDGGTVPSFQVSGTSQSAGSAVFTAWGTTATSQANLYLGKGYNATPGTYTAIASGQNLGNITFFGSDGVGLYGGANIYAVTTGLWTTTSQPAEIRFNTTPTGSGTGTLRMTIGSEGNIAFGATTDASSHVYNVATYTNVESATKYNLQNFCTITGTDASADRSVYSGNANLVDISYQNDNAFSLTTFGTYNSIRTTTTGGNSVGEGSIYAAYNYGYNNSDDATYNIMQTIIASYNRAGSNGNTARVGNAYGTYSYIYTGGTAASPVEAITTGYASYATVNASAANRNIGTAYGYYLTASETGTITTKWGFYEAIDWANYFGGDVRTNNGFLHTTAVNNSNTSVTLSTTSTLAGGIRTGTPAANINYTLPTGTNCDAYFTNLQTNMGAEWNIVNLAAATYSITVLANTGHTVVGNMVVAANTSARFLSRKTGTNTFVTYRIA